MSHHASAREAIARCLTEQPAFGFTERNRLQGADVILQYLDDAGLSIVRFVKIERPPFEIVDT